MRGCSAGEAEEQPVDCRLGCRPGSLLRLRGRPALRGSFPDGAAREFLAPLPVSLLCGRLGDEGRRPPQRARAAGDRHPGAAGRPAARRGRRPLRAAGAAGAAAGPRRGRAAAPAAGAGGDRGRAGAARGGLRPAARAGAGAADLAPARPPRAARQDAAGAAGSPPGSRPAGAGGARWRCGAPARTGPGSRDALLPHLALLPAPAATLRLEALELGPETGEQLSLSSPEQERRRRISEAVRQTRSAAGADAVLRVLEVDPESRVPERREVLMPFPEEHVMRPGRLNRPWPVPVQVGPDGTPAGGRPAGGRVGPRGVAGRGRLVDAETPAKALFRAGARGRQRRGRLLRAGLGRWFRQRD